VTTPLRLLIVEDSEEDANQLIKQLDQGGYAVISERVSNIEQMEKSLRNKTWDLVISGYNLPEVNGLVPLKVLQDLALDIPFVIVSGSIGEETAVEAMKAGAHDYINKTNLARLLPAVERELRETESRKQRQRAEKVQAATYRISDSASQAENLGDLFARIHLIVGELMPAQNFSIALVDSKTNELHFPYFIDEYMTIPDPTRPRRGLTEYVLRIGKPLLASTEIYTQLQEAGEVDEPEKKPYSWLGVPLRAQDNITGVLAVRNYTTGKVFSEEDLNILSFVSTQVAMAISRKQAEEALRQSEARYRSLFENSPISLWEEDFSKVKAYIDNLRSQGVINLKEYLDKNPQFVEEAMRQIRVIDVNQATLRLYGASSKDELLTSLSSVLGADTRDVVREELIAIIEGKTEFSGIGVNYKLNGEPFDCVLQWTILPEYQQVLSNIIVSIQDITENKQAEEQIQDQLDRLAALRTVDMAITASLDLRVTLDVLLDQVTLQLRSDAACILLLNPHTQVLSYAAGRGFRNAAINRTSLHLNDSFAGRAIIERRLLSFTNLEESEPLLRKRQLVGENFEAYFCIPLIAKGQIKGVLEVFHRSPLNPNNDWLDFLETLAGQAAIAIDNATLFNNLQRSNVELAIAYEATIEGWSRALDLRDKETEGHTERVTEMTLRLASSMGITDDDLVHIRRGALLHDIGKMGISDNILLKPGPLTDEEWRVMRLHPVYAYELLSPISYLRNSLDIPYCHHEKWDGSGYPRRLLGDEIPLAARIFAVVDVWDALRSDRPYRKAWSEDEVCDYLLYQRGRHFDPVIVDLFLKTLKSKATGKISFKTGELRF
jgi:PAS domain S-box-containing protein